MDGFRIGQYVVVTSRRGRVVGTISDRYCNPFSGEMEYSVDFNFKNGKWRMICVPEYAIRLVLTYTFFRLRESVSVILNKLTNNIKI